MLILIPQSFIFSTFIHANMIAKKPDEVSTSSVPAKRSIFNKPSWSNPQQSQNTDDCFNRSNHTYIDIAAEAARKRERKLIQRNKEQLQEISTCGQPDKRRRVSVDSGNDGNSSSSDEDVPPEKEANLKGNRFVLDPTAGVTSPVKREVSPKSLARRYDHYITARKRDEEPKPSPSNVIVLEDDKEDNGDQEDSNDPQVTMIKVSKPLEDDDFPASEEEFPELARKAREKARRKRLETDIAFEPPNRSFTTGESGCIQPSQLIPQSTPPLPQPDSIVQIMITSQIENTEPLIVRRKVSQRLKDVRLAWCHRQEFSPEFIPTVFLTWKGKRLFDVTTCKSLGITVDQYGNILVKGHKDIMEEVVGQIHMEAMTDKILEEYRKTKFRAMLNEDEEDAAVPNEPSPERKKELQVKIVLKARGYEDLKLIVRPVNHL